MNRTHRNNPSHSKAKSAAAFLLVGFLAAMLSVTGCLGQSAYKGKVPPGSCPEGWRPATPPLNPVMICLPDNLTIKPREPVLPDIPEGKCPQGWERVSPPQNPILSCLPTQEAAQSTRALVPPGDCPEGWRPVTPPLNPILSCLPNTIVLAPAPEGRVPPGECPEGWRRATPPLNPILGCLPNTFAP